jgi:hypothetical protein
VIQQTCPTQASLVSENSSYLVLHCRTSFGPKEEKFYDIEFIGLFDTMNQSLVEQIDRFVDDNFAPKIQGRVGASQFINLACLGIGYFKMLIWVRIVNQSHPPHDKYDFSVVFAYFILKRIDELLSSSLSSVRSGQRDIDKEAMPGLVIWALFISSMHSQLQKLEGCKMFVCVIHAPRFTSADHSLG